MTALCRSNFVTIPLHSTVCEALTRIRGSAQRGDIFYLYVVDEHKHLSGVVSIRNLLLAKDHEPVASLLSRNLVVLSTETPLKEAYKIFSESRFLSLPVLTPAGHIMGVVHAHELLEQQSKRQHDTLFEERSRGELFELLGIKAEDQERSSSHIAVGRIPWLLINILGGSFSAFLIHGLAKDLANAVQLLAFVPVILIVAESVGMQAASLAIANLRDGGGRKRALTLLKKELPVAFCLGFLCALIVGGALYFLSGSVRATLPIVVATVLGTLWVSALGTLIPSLFHRLKLDPRISAGPFILALSDCSTLLIYLASAVWLSP